MVQDEEEQEAEKEGKGKTLGISVGRLIRDAEGRVIGFETPDADSEDDDASRGDPSNEAMNGKGREQETPWGAPMPEDRPVVPVVAKTPVVLGELVYL